jgi:hypothetical protein
MINVSDIANRVINELGHFDSNQANFNGAWSVFPYFDSGHVLISDINGGLFIVRNNTFLVTIFKKQHKNAKKHT